MKKGKGGDQASLRLQWIDAIQHDELVLNFIFIKFIGMKLNSFQSKSSKCNRSHRYVGLNYF